MYYENDLSFLFRETAITMKHSKGEQKCQHNSSTLRCYKDFHNTVGSTKDAMIWKTLH